MALTRYAVGFIWGGVVFTLCFIAGQNVAADEPSTTQIQASKKLSLGSRLKR